MPALADIFRRHGSAYVQQFGSRMPPGHRRVLRDVVRCRTPEAGGQLWHCPKCGKDHAACHSCGNRHCPTCGGDDARAWLDRQLALQLPVSYYLVTCTVPEPLRAPTASKPKGYLALLFRSASRALVDLCRNPKWFGAMPGITAILHTWTRSLSYHPHIHFLVTGGGMDPTGAWRQPQTGFLLPAPALSAVFRARFRDGLKRLDPQTFAAVPAKVWKTDWVVDVTHVGSGENALKYLARYVFRVALTDSAILRHDDTKVTFRYRDSDTGKSRKMSLPVFAFVHRFLQHVLPKGFVKVRYYGLHHPTHRAALTLARAQLYLRLNQPLPPPPPVQGKPPMCCPECKTPMTPGPRFLPGHLPPTHAPPA